jgi:hypothetical protein
MRRQRPSSRASRLAYRGLHRGTLMNSLVDRVHFGAREVLFLKLFRPFLRRQITSITGSWSLPGDFRPLASDFSLCRSDPCSLNLVLAVDADNHKKRGWSLGWVSAVDSERRTIWIADAHRGDRQRFIVRADERLTAFSRTRSGDSVSKLEASRSASHLRLRT